ncbi:MAG TPA: TRAP transporter small permease subunit [Caldimonas sp.]|nr:TRAP transporter small permease subunit [Caldimonas sp.]
MPSLTFVLPHWLYWSTLLVFPLIAIWLVRRQHRRGPPREPILFTAYLFWVCAGYMGLHRLYLRSWWGLLYVPLFCAVVYCNSEQRESREDVSRTGAALEQFQTALKGAQPIDAASPTADERAAVAKAEADIRRAQAESEAAVAVHEGWRSRSRNFGLVIVALMAIDAVLIPGLVRRRREQRAGYAANPIGPEPVDVPQQGTAEDPTMRLRSPFTNWIDRMNGAIGEYVAYWAVISVFVYYYEVLARFVFNSPTNWVHESMFLMFGMQYMLSGAYAYREDQHVRVDVVYTKLSTRGKAIADIMSSLFFFIFALTLLWTGWRFAADAVGNHETSFTEWGIQYWPVKLTIPIGAALIILQGLSKLVKDVLLLRHGDA